MSDKTARDHARDHADQNQIRQLADTIRAFLDDPPHRASNQTRNALNVALGRLGDDAERIVKIWD